MLYTCAGLRAIRTAAAISEPTPPPHHTAAHPASAKYRAPSYVLCACRLLQIP